MKELLYIKPYLYRQVTFYVGYGKSAGPSLRNPLPPADPFQLHPQTGVRRQLDYSYERGMQEAFALAGTVIRNALIALSEGRYSDAERILRNPVSGQH